MFSPSKRQGIVLADILLWMHVMLQFPSCFYVEPFPLFILFILTAVKLTHRKSLSHSKGWLFRTLLVLSHSIGTVWWIKIGFIYFCFQGIMYSFTLFQLLPHCSYNEAGSRMSLFSRLYGEFRRINLLNSFPAVLPSPSAAEPLCCSEGWRERHGEIARCRTFSPVY